MQNLQNRSVPIVFAFRQPRRHPILRDCAGVPEYLLSSLRSGRPGPVKAPGPVSRPLRGRAH
ncbi:hypothetical protein BH09PSE6_BH09PSE6_30450 [soil metagenome]